MNSVNQSSVTTNSSKSDRVRAVFEKPDRYLARMGTAIRIRAETVLAVSDGARRRRILDIGCGDASISLPLVDKETQLTLLDISTNMTSIAQSHLPLGLAKNVQVRNEDFMAAKFSDQSFDEIVCLGLMAHVDSPDDFIHKIAGLLTPNGILILEFTDAYHFAGRAARLGRWFWELVAPPRFSVNLLSFAQVNRLLSKNGLRLVSTFRYALPPIPRIEKVLGPEILHRIVRWVFGSVKQSRNARWGNEYICIVSLDRPAELVETATQGGRSRSDGIKRSA